MSFFDMIVLSKQSKHYKTRKCTFLPSFIYTSLHKPLSRLYGRKRASQKLSGSATVEAAMIFPLILFFFISVMWFIELFHIHSEIGAELNLIGNEMVAYSYPYSVVKENLWDNNELTDLALSVGWTELYVKGRLEKLAVYDKTKSMTTLLSDYSTEDAIDIVVTYSVKPVIDIPGLPDVILTNHFYSKMFTGYGGKKTENDELVYITATGSVYHTSLSCRSLKYDIHSVPLSKIGNERNESGSIYYPCEKCMKNDHEGTVFITQYGTRYHSSKTCSELKVDIFEVPLSTVGDRPKCKFCEGGGN